MATYVLEVHFEFQGKQNTLFPVILKNDREAILVDCGYAGFLPLLEKAANRHGISLNDLTGIMVTHHDVDHIGALYEIKQQYPQLKVYTSEIEAPYIDGRKKSLRLEQAEALYDSLPDEHKQGALHFQEMLKGVRPVSVDVTFSDLAEPEHLSGITILDTPGHMPGHFSIYVKQTKTLIAADAVILEDGVLNIANPRFTLDLNEAVASIKKIQKLSLNKIICYHGGVVEGDIQRKLAQLIDQYNSGSAQLHYL